MHCMYFTCDRQLQLGVTSKLKSPGLTLGARQLRLHAPEPQVQVLPAASSLNHITLMGPSLSTVTRVSPVEWEP